MKTIENNKLIAAFMGKEVYQHVHESHYHESWSWLMPVVEKIDMIGASVIIGRMFCEIKYIDPLNEEKAFNVRIVSGVKINAIIGAIVEFIIFYNKHKEVPKLNPIEGINYKLLRSQKESLIRMVEEAKTKGSPEQKKEAESTEGIINLIDSIQDYAVGSLGMKETIVFGLKS